MPLRTRPSDRRPRLGVAAVEFALLLPLFGFILVAATDYARSFDSLSSLANCACDGALDLPRSPDDPMSPARASRPRPRPMPPPFSPHGHLLPEGGSLQRPALHPGKPPGTGFSHSPITRGSLV